MSTQNSSGMKGKPKYFHTKRICHQQTYSKRIAKGNYANRMETIKKKIKPESLGKNTENKNIDQYNRISSL